MFGFLLRRAGLVIPTFFGITLLVFTLIHMIPGDPVEAMSGERGMDPARYTQLAHELGLDQPLYLQYFSYIKQVASGNLGLSYVTHEPVLREFATLFPATLELSTCAIILALLIGMPAGILAALKRNTVLDYSVMGVSLTGGRSNMMSMRPDTGVQPSVTENSRISKSAHQKIGIE